MEGQPIRRLRRLQNLPPLITLEHPPPPQRQRLDMNGSFELVGVSEVPGEPSLIANRLDFDTVEIEYLQTDLNDPMIVQVRPFDSSI